MRDFLLRVLAFAVLVLALQVILSRWFEASFPELSKMDRHLAARADIITFGDSVSFYYARTDRTRRGIPDLLQDLLPAYSVRSVEHSAYHLGIYRPFCEYVRRAGSTPRVLIIPINLGSLSALWLRRPEYQFQKESVILAYRTRYYDSILMRSFLRPLLIFHAYDLRQRVNSTPEANKSALEHSGVDDDAEGIAWKRYADTSQQDMRRWLAGRYMYSLEEGHPRIRDMLAIIKTFRGSKTKLFFYLTPIDYETGRRVVGEAFSSRVRDNTGLIGRLAAEQEVSLSDLTVSLGADVFGWRSDRVVPNEHLAEAGRRYVAERIAGRLKELLSD